MDKTTIKPGSTPLKGKREKFAQEMAKGDCNNTEAALKANYKNHKGLKFYAYKLTTNPDIKARITFLRNKLTEKLDITKEKYVGWLLEMKEIAIDNDDISACNGTMTLIGKATGLISDRIVNETPQIPQLTPQQIEDAKLFAEWKLNHANKGTCDRMDTKEKEVGTSQDKEETGNIEADTEQDDSVVTCTKPAYEKLVKTAQY